MDNPDLIWGILDSMADAVFLLDAERRILALNEAAARRLGRPVNELVGACLCDVCPPESRALRKDKLEQVFAEGKLVHFDDQQAGKWLSHSLYPICDAAGKVEQVLVSARDITERKQVEADLRKLNVEQQFIFDSVPAMIWYKDIHNRFLKVNKAVTRSMGMPAEAIEGKTAYELFPDEAEHYFSDDQEVIATGQPKLGIIEQVKVLATGEKRWVQTDKIPCRDEAGRVTGLLVFVMDITAIKQAEEMIKQSAEEISRANKELEQFVTIASHDIQEPLRVISNFLQLLEKRCQDQLDEKGKDYIRRAVNAAQRMQALINDLLAYSQVTRGESKELGPCRLEAVLKNAVGYLQVAIEKSRAIITHDPLPVIEGDEMQWVRVFLNMISNALKFCDKAYPVIHISAADLGQEWQLSFRDNGVGIAPEHIKLLFAVFMRLHPRNQYPGTGIGLAICKKIVERHGGSIRVESEPGKGSTFIIVVPKRKRGQP